MIRDHPFKTSGNFHYFWPLPPSVASFLLPSVSKLDRFLTLPSTNCWRLTWMVPKMNWEKKLLHNFSLSSDSGAEWTGSTNRQNPVKSWRNGSNWYYWRRWRSSRLRRRYAFTQKFLIRAIIKILEMFSHTRLLGHNIPTYMIIRTQRLLWTSEMQYAANSNSSVVPKTWRSHINCISVSTIN